MHIRSTAVSLGALAALMVSLAGCAKVANLRARSAFKEAGTFYQAQNYKRAAEKYEETLQLDPNYTQALFYLGNSYDQLYKPERKGEPGNDAYLIKATEMYKQAAERETDPKLRKLALEYLVASYGPDRLDDPARAEPMIQALIKADPTDPGNYFALGKIYEDSGNYDVAETTYLKAKEVKPNDPAVYMMLAGYYSRQGEFDKTIDALQQRLAREPNNPEAHYTIASFYWDKAYRDFRLKDPEKKDFVQKGIAEVDRAIEIKPDYLEAIVYKGLLLRLQANLEKDVARQQALLKQAEALQVQAKELQKKKTAGVSD